MTPEEKAREVENELRYDLIGDAARETEIADHNRSVIAKAIQAERERCAKIANEKRSYSPFSNPSDMDRGWKRCAKAIEDAIYEKG